MKISVRVRKHERHLTLGKEICILDVFFFFQLSSKAAFLTSLMQLWDWPWSRTCEQGALRPNWVEGSRARRHVSFPRPVLGDSGCSTRLALVWRRGGAPGPPSRDMWHKREAKCGSFELPRLCTVTQHHLVCSEGHTGTSLLGCVSGS